MNLLKGLFTNFSKYFNIFLNIGLKDKKNIQEKKNVNLINFYNLIFFQYVTLMGTINVIDKTFIIGSINLLISVLIIINLILFGKFKNLEIASHISIILLAFILIFTFISGGKENTGFLWLIIFPFGPLQLIGVKKGTLYFLGFLFFQIFSKNCSWVYDYGKVYENFDNIFIRIILIEIFLYIVAYYFIRNRNEHYLEIDNINKQKINLFINLAHETKTPLTLINNYLDKYIKKKGITEELSIIKENLDKMTNDMIDYLDIEKLERSQNLYDHDNIINLSRTIKIKSLLFKEIAKKKEIKIKLNIPDNIYIRIDPNAIDRILNNLFDNAIKYNKENGLMNIRLITLKDKVEFIIEDTGIGIDEEEIKYIFDPFYQSSKIKKNIQGIGMGLAIIKKITDEINAKVEVSSRINKGTIFKILFDSYKLIEGDKINEEIKYSQIKSSKRKQILEKTKYLAARNNIFVVEDNTELLLFMQNNMKEKYNFYYALNGKEALIALKVIPKPDIIISDIMMNEMDGYTFLEHINNSEEFKSVPFIFLTAKSFEEDRLRGLKNGAIDFISKPFSIEILLTKIESIIKNQELRNEMVLKNIGEEINDYLNINSKTRGIGIERINFDLIGKLHSEFCLTKKELEIINQLKKGFKYKEIGKNLDISINTVRTHIKRIFEKCRVRSTRELLNLISNY